MYRVVMVPTDGSDASLHAIPLALAVARPSKAVLALVAVLDSAFGSAEETALRELSERIAASGGVTVTATIVEGDVVAALERFVETSDVDLVVMATHGRGGIKRAVLGSVADELVRSISCPLMLARPRGTLAHEHEPATITHVLIPLDGSIESDAIVGDAADVAVLTGARCTLLYVSHPETLGGIAAPDGLLDPVAEQRSDDAEQARLERFAELFRARSVAVSTVVLRGDNPTEAIVEYAGTHAVDLIAMATHGRHGLARLMLGSTASALLHETWLPVMLLRSDVSSPRT